MAKKQKVGGGEKAGEILRAQLGGSVSCGEERTSVGLKLARGVLTLAQADALLTHARLDVRMQGMSAEEKEGQELLWDDAAPEQRSIEAEADCRGFSVGKDGLSARLTFASSQTEVVDALLALRGADVRVSFARVGDAGEHEAEDAE